MSKFDEIKKFAELLDEGVISQEEFDKEKAKILGTKKPTQKTSTPKTSSEKKEFANGNTKWIVAIVVLIAIGGLFGQGDNQSSSSQSSIQESSQVTQANRCTRVSQSFLDELAGNDGFDLRNGFVVNSADFQDGWSFVSAEAYNSGGLGIDGKILSWFVDQYPSSNYIEGVGAFGEEYSSWGASINNKKGSPYDDGYSESRDCVK